MKNVILKSEGLNMKKKNKNWLERLVPQKLKFEVLLLHQRMLLLLSFPLKIAHSFLMLDATEDLVLGDDLLPDVVNQDEKLFVPLNGALVVEFDALWIEWIEARATLVVFKVQDSLSSSPLNFVADGVPALVQAEVLNSA